MKSAIARYSDCSSRSSFCRFKEVIEYQRNVLDQLFHTSIEGTLAILVHEILLSPSLNTEILIFFCQALFCS